MAASPAARWIRPFGDSRHRMQLPPKPTLELGRSPITSSWQKRLRLYNLRTSNLSAAVVRSPIPEAQSRAAKEGSSQPRPPSRASHASSCWKCRRRRRAPDTIQFNPGIRDRCWHSKRWPKGAGCRCRSSDCQRTTPGRSGTGSSSSRRTISLRPAACCGGPATCACQCGWTGRARRHRGGAGGGRGQGRATGGRVHPERKDRAPDRGLLSEPVAFPEVAPGYQRAEEGNPPARNRPEKHREAAGGGGAG
jgi:hypothetical protein